MIGPSFSQNSLRILSALRREVSTGYQLFHPLGFKDAKELTEAITPLVDAGLVSFSGEPYSERGVVEAYYHVPPSRAAYVDALLSFTPAKLSPLPSPPDNALSQDTRLVLRALRSRGMSDGYSLMHALGTRDAAQFAAAIDPLTERGIVHYAGKPFTEDGLKTAMFTIMPSMAGYADMLLAFNPPKFGGGTPAP